MPFATGLERDRKIDVSCDRRTELMLYRLWNEHGSLVQGFDMPIATEVCKFFQLYSYFAPRSLTKCFL